MKSETFAPVPSQSVLAAGQVVVLMELLAAIDLVARLEQEFFQIKTIECRLSETRVCEQKYASVLQMEYISVVVPPHMYSLIACMEIRKLLKVVNRL